MTEKALLEKQFAIDFSDEVINTNQNVFVTNQSHQEMRYWARGAGSIVCYNGRLLVRTNKKALTEELKAHYKDKSATWFFEMEPLETVSAILKKHHLEITRLAPFFIPQKKVAQPKRDTRFVHFTKEETQTFQNDKRIKEAFCYSETDPDMLGVGYYEKEELKAICGANRIGKYMFEIGVEILDDAFMGCGIASRLVQRITATIQTNYPDIIPIYGTALSHTKSMNVAINAGYKVGWSELLIGE